jgi:hypothetical protein
MVFHSTVLISLNWQKQRHRAWPHRHRSIVLLAVMLVWLHLTASSAEITAGTCSCIPAGERVLFAPAAQLLCAP